MKQGEKEAKIILEKFGVKFDPSYQDENIGKSMPDLKYSDGRYLEVTHTKHNKAIFTSMGKFWKQSSEKQLETLRKILDEWGRLNKADYQMEEEKLTEDGRKQLRGDLTSLKKQCGYSPNSHEIKFSEFKCNMPIIEFSNDKILNEIVNDKGKKYPNGDTDLFLFVSEEEFNCLFSELEQYQWNAAAQHCIEMILSSPFPIIYICIWDIFKQKYETENPVIFKMEKKDGGVNVVKLK